MKCTTCKKRMQLVSVSHDFVIKGKGIKVVNIPAEQSSGGGRVEVSGSKGILTSDTYGLLRTLCSRNPKNIRNPPYSGYFLMFCMTF